MSNTLHGGEGAGNIKAQRGLASAKLILLIGVISLVLNIPLFLGLQMFSYQDNPAEKFDAAPIAAEQVSFTKVYSNQTPSQVFAYLLPGEGENVKLIITEKHPWLDRWRTVKTITLMPQDNRFTTRVMCDAGFVNLTVTNRSNISSFTITQTLYRLPWLEIPIIYIFILIAMLILEIAAVLLFRKLRS